MLLMELGPSCPITRYEEGHACSGPVFLPGVSLDVSQIGYSVVCGDSPEGVNGVGFEDLPVVVQVAYMREERMPTEPGSFGLRPSRP